MTAILERRESESLWGRFCILFASELRGEQQSVAMAEQVHFHSFVFISTF
jgi:hypothetical protein